MNNRILEIFKPKPKINGSVLQIDSIGNEVLISIAPQKTYGAPKSNKNSTFDYKKKETFTMKELKKLRFSKFIKSCKKIALGDVVKNKNKIVEGFGELQLLSLEDNAKSKKWAPIQFKKDMNNPEASFFINHSNSKSPKTISILFSKFKGKFSFLILITNKNKSGKQKISLTISEMELFVEKLNEKIEHLKPTKVIGINGNVIYNKAMLPNLVPGQMFSISEQKFGVMKSSYKAEEDLFYLQTKKI